MDAVTASVSANLATALHDLQQIPGQLSAQAKAAAEARLQQLIETYRKLALIADPQTLARLAKQIGVAARSLGGSAATSSLPSISQSAGANPAQADDTTAKTILVQAGSVVEAIRRRLSFVAAAARHPDRLKADLKTVDSAGQAVADALNAVGGPYSPPVGSASMNLVA